MGVLSVKNPNVTYISAAASELDLPDNSVDIVTIFEVLEHIHTDEVNKTIHNLFRISKKYVCLSVTHRLSGEKTQQGDNLHLTVKPWGWWETKLKQYGSLVKIIENKNQHNTVCIWEK